MSAESVNDTMNLIRRLATHLAAEPNLPDVRDLTRGEVDAWIRALNTEIEPRAVDFLSVPVLEILLHRQQLGIWDNPSCLARAPNSHFNPVVVNPWDPDDTFYVVDAERLRVRGSSPSSRPVVEGIERINIASVSPIHTDVSMSGVNPEGDIDTTMGEPTETDIPEQDTSGEDSNNPDDSELENTVINSVAQNQIALTAPEPDEDDAKHTDSDHTDEEQEDESAEESTTHRVEIPTEVNIQPEPEPQGPENADPSSITDDSDGDDPDRELWCHCNLPQDDRAMVQCKNHKDPECMGKWYHTSCAGLTRIPPEKSDWYCRDCRKKLQRGLYTNGVVG